MLFFPYFAVTYPEDLQLVLSSRKHTEKVFFYKMLHNFLGNGLITSSGKEQEYGVKKKNLKVSEVELDQISLTKRHVYIGF